MERERWRRRRGDERFVLILIGHANDPAGWTGPCTARLLAVVGAALAEIVGAGVHHHRASQHRVGPHQLDVGVRAAALGHPVAVRGNVAQVADMADRILGRPVVLAVRVEVGSGRRAAVGIVAKLVDVHAALGVGVVALDVPADGGGAVLARLLKRHYPAHLAISPDDCDCFHGGGGGGVKVGLGGKL